MYSICHLFCYIYLQPEIQNGIILTNNGHFHYPADFLFTLLFDADDAGAAKLHPKVDANGNCTTGDGEVSLPLLFFLNIFECSCGFTE